MTIQLDPPRLGKMRLEISVEDEVVKVHIQAENSDVRDALQADLQQLERALREVCPGSQRASVSGFWAESESGGRGTDSHAGSDQSTGYLPSEPDGGAAPTEDGWIRTSDAGSIDCLV
jgi:hypothetical protein